GCRSLSSSRERPPRRLTLAGSNELRVILLRVGTAAADLVDEFYRVSRAARLRRRTLDASFDLAVGVGLAQLGAKLIADGDLAAVRNEDVAVGVGGLSAEGSGHPGLAVDGRRRCG